MLLYRTMIGMALHEQKSCGLRTTTYTASHKALTFKFKENSHLFTQHLLQPRHSELEGLGNSRQGKGQI